MKHITTTEKIFLVPLVVGTFLVGSPTLFAQTASTTVEITGTTTAEYTEKVNNLLNQTITPASTTPAETTPAQLESTSTAASTIVPSSSSTNGTDGLVSSQKNTTPVVATNDLFTPTSNNYYVPLDSLSPEMTYLLSGIAMLLGVWGAFLIIREPQEAVVWTPKIKARETLLN